MLKISFDIYQKKEKEKKLWLSGFDLKLKKKNVWNDYSKCFAFMFCSKQEEKESVEFLCGFFCHAELSALECLSTTR